MNSSGDPNDKKIEDQYNIVAVNSLRAKTQEGRCSIGKKIKDIMDVKVPNLQKQIVTEQIKMKFVPYQADEVNDQHWGCAWRAIQMVLSSQFEGPIPEFKWLFSFFGQKSVLEDIYLTKKGLTELPVELQEAKYAPQELDSGWAEPYIGNLIFYYLGFRTALKTINGYPKGANAPEYVFEANLDFAQLQQFLLEHFGQYKSPVMIDDGHFALVISGIKHDGGTVILSIGDPHIFSNKEAQYEQVGQYDVLLNQQGEQLSNTIPQDTIDQYIYTQSYLGVRFDGKPWMMTYALDAFDVWNVWQQEDLIIAQKEV